MGPGLSRSSPTRWLGTSPPALFFPSLQPLGNPASQILGGFTPGRIAWSRRQRRVLGGTARVRSLGPLPGGTQPPACPASVSENCPDTPNKFSGILEAEGWEGIPGG